MVPLGGDSDGAGGGDGDANDDIDEISKRRRNILKTKCQEEETQQT
jgi:hypothetical protein